LARDRAPRTVRVQVGTLTLSGTIPDVAEDEGGLEVLHMEVARVDRPRDFIRAVVTALVLAAQEGRPVRVVSLGAKREKGVPTALRVDYVWPQSRASTGSEASTTSGAVDDAAPSRDDLRKAAVDHLTTIVNIWRSGMERPLRASEYASKAWFDVWQAAERAARVAPTQEAEALRAAGLEEALEEALGVWKYDQNDAHLQAVYGTDGICEDATGGGSHPDFVKDSLRLWSALFPLPPEDEPSPHGTTEEGGA
jgi:hypothetical protein